MVNAAELKGRKPAETEREGGRQTPLLHVALVQLDDGEQGCTFIQLLKRHRPDWQV